MIGPTYPFPRVNQDIDPFLRGNTLPPPTLEIQSAVKNFNSIVGMEARTNWSRQSNITTVRTCARLPKRLDEKLIFFLDLVGQHGGACVFWLSLQPRFIFCVNAFAHPRQVCTPGKPSQARFGIFQTHWAFTQKTVITRRLRCIFATLATGNFLFEFLRRIFPSIRNTSRRNHVLEHSPPPQHWFGHRTRAGVNGPAKQFPYLIVLPEFSFLTFQVPSRPLLIQPRTRKAQHGVPQPAAEPAGP